MVNLSPDLQKITINFMKEISELDADTYESPIDMYEEILCLSIKAKEILLKLD